MDSAAEGRDLTVLAVPVYFASMAAEYLWLRRRAARTPATAAAAVPAAADYERRDTMASLSMGVGSLLAPLVVPRVLRAVTPGRGRYARALWATAAGAAVATTVADRLARRADTRQPDKHRPGEQLSGEQLSGDHVPSGPRPGEPARTTAGPGWARRMAAVGGVTTVVAGGVALTAAWNTATSNDRLWRRRIVSDRGTGPLAVLAAVAGWDFIYYLNHRFMHESRYMWAMHVVHHSSEHYNLSTALRQPVADAFTTKVPEGLLCLFGLRPAVVQTANGLNLLYQFFIHTETVDRLGPAEAVLNTPSHHRVHHGSNRQYLDRNHGSILIVWDRLLGTFEPEGEPVVYGLTKNIETFNPWRIAGHEHAQLLRDVARADNWVDRLSFVFRGPGWATRRRAELDGAGLDGAGLDGAGLDRAGLEAVALDRGGQPLPDALGPAGPSVHVGQTPGPGSVDPLLPTLVR